MRWHPPWALLALAACAGPRAPAPTASPPAPGVACRPGASLPAGALTPGTVLLFGELHGTRELPALFGELVCEAAHAGPVTVGLEMPGSEQQGVERYLASAGGPADRAALLAGPIWTRDYQYGYSSAATVGLLERLRQLRASGLPLEVALFDVEKGGPDRDEKMAGAIAARIHGRPGAPFLALTGNYHARARPGAPWNPAQRWMGGYLRDAGLRVLGFDLGREVEGMAWICSTAEARSCGAKPVKVMQPLPVGARRGVVLLAEETPEGYAGLWAVESLTASPPAVAKER